MIRRIFVLLLLSVIVIGGSASVRTTGSANPEPCAQDHEVWLAHLMEKMETIKPGMTSKFSGRKEEYQRQRQLQLQQDYSAADL
jgi:Skp family chaperone for outer membrane proteins